MRRAIVSYWMIVLLGIGLVLPSLGTGFLMDDYIHLAALEGKLPGWTNPLDLFRFAQPADVGEAIRNGLYPWWTSPDFRVGFFRPLSSATLWLDHRLFGHQATGYHAQSLMWFLAVLVVWGRLLRRTLTGSLATLAFVLFVVDDGHLFPVTWIAGRHAVVSTLLPLLGLWAHLRWREEKWRPGLPLSIAAFAAGLLGGETAVGVLAYVVSYELVGRRTIRALTPIVVLGLVYAVVYRTLGYGVTDSGVYHSPFDGLFDFAHQVSLNLATLLTGVFLGVPILGAFLEPSWRIPLGIVGLGGSLLLWRLLRAALESLSEADRRAVRWLGIGCLLSLLPSALTLPHDRLLMVPSLGGSVLLAVILHHAWRVLRRTAPGARALTVGVGAWLALVHLVAAPAGLVAWQVFFGELGAWHVVFARTVEWGEGTEHIVLPVSPDYLVSMYLPLILAEQGRSLPSWYTLSMASADHRLTRTGPRTIELEIDGGNLLEPTFANLYRGGRSRLRVGDRVDAGLFRAHILDTDGRAPTRMEFTFDRDVDEQSLQTLLWDGTRLKEVRLPAPGGRLDIPWLLGPASGSARE